MAKAYITLIDQNGRNIIGVDVSRNDKPDFIDIENPMMIIAQPQQNNQLTVQLVPLFMGEFIAANALTNRNFTYRYSRHAVAVSVGLEIDNKIATQYDRVVQGAFNIAPAAKEEVPGEIIKLFQD